MEDTIISFETAILAKEKGFNIIVNKYYKSQNLLVLEDGIEIFLLDNTEKIDYSHISYCDLYLAPSQSLLQKWLREVHKIWIEIYMNNDISNKSEYYSFLILTKNGGVINHNSTGGNHKNYEQALEEGLKQALLLI